ncbi:MAG TPA: hypothetical protein VL547_03325 [Dinghuibacter sp.]|uniref:hypothetical protein n=1 Tax=Dinghuibacter sp. TaxID=2024697 RepID=UPI002BD38D1A|nr:hypothetical protein [Dinghuibacter sp.]HTJ11022.1 hypothetical protein [Dinghuibacter sp.]
MISNTLRIASAMCFIGHGIFGIITKAVWCNYFGVFGVGHDLAYRLMPVVGSIDILFGVSLLAYPVRAVFAWLVVWGLFTAALRPLSGEPLAEFFERAGNYGAPLAFLLYVGRGPWFARVSGGTPSSSLRWCLRIAAFLLLAGHGWLNLLGKASLVAQYTRFGLGASAAWCVGVFEVVAAVAVLVRPLRGLLFFLFFWKMSSELWYPRYEVVEWVERGGSYGVLLALALIAPPSRAVRNIAGLAT